MGEQALAAERYAGHRVEAERAELIAGQLRMPGPPGRARDLRDADFFARPVLVVGQAFRPATSAATRELMTRSKPVVLYDGVCGLCNGLVRFVLPRDRHDAFRFASLQSGFSRRVLEGHRRE